MKKICLALLLILSGCTYIEDYKTKQVVNEIEDGKESNTIIDTENLNKVIGSLVQKELKDELRLEYKDHDFNLDELVKRASFVVPFDIKVKKFQTVAELSQHSVIEIEYLDKEYQKCIEEANRIIREIIDDTMDDKTKVNTIYHYIIDHCQYDQNITFRNVKNEEAFQVHGVLFNQKAVCTGYARTFMLFMHLLDIPCIYVPSDVMNHSFNLVYDGEFRYIDVTWDDSTYTYYGLDRNAFFSDGKHLFDQGYDDEFFMNFMCDIYQLEK